MGHQASRNRSIPAAVFRSHLLVVPRLRNLSSSALTQPPLVPAEPVTCPGSQGKDPELSCDGQASRAPRSETKFWGKCQSPISQDPPRQNLCPPRLAFSCLPRLQRGYCCLQKIVHSQRLSCHWQLVLKAGQALPLYPLLGLSSQQAPSTLP